MVIQDHSDPFIANSTTKNHMEARVRVWELTAQMVCTWIHTYQAVNVHARDNDVENGC